MKMLLAAAGLGMVVQAGAQATGSVEVSADRTVPPAEFAPVVTVAAKGVQIYRCEVKEGGAAGWVFMAPEATLSADGTAVGTHGAGPSWHWMDGSAVSGQKVEVKQAAPGSGSIPWLLVRVGPGAGAAAAGKLVGVGYVRRWETAGGVEPMEGCDGAHEKVEVRVPYTAKYTFYKATQ